MFSTEVFSILCCDAMTSDVIRVRTNENESVLGEQSRNKMAVLGQEKYLSCLT